MNKEMQKTNNNKHKIYNSKKCKLIFFEMFVFFFSYSNFNEFDYYLFLYIDLTTIQLKKTFVGFFAGSKRLTPNKPLSKFSIHLIASMNNIINNYLINVYFT